MLYMYLVYLQAYIQSSLWEVSIDQTLNIWEQLSKVCLEGKEPTQSWHIIFYTQATLCMQRYKESDITLKNGWHIFTLVSED